MRKREIIIKEIPKKGDSLTVYSYPDGASHSIKIRKNSSAKSIANKFNKFFKEGNHPYYVTIGL